MKIIEIHKETIKPTPPPPIVVNGVIIEPEAIAAEAQHHPMPKEKADWAWEAAAQALVLRELLLQEARAQGIESEPIELSTGLWETDEEACIRQLLEQHMPEQRIDDGVLREIYDRAPERFLGPSLYEAAHLLFPASPNDQEARTKARAHAEAVLLELQKNPLLFASLAAKHSACPSKENGGLLGQLSSGDTVPEFEAALLSMQEGELSTEPIETRYGYHIIRLDAKAPGQVLPFETVLPQLRQAQEKANWVRAGQAYMATLVERADISGIDVSKASWAQI